MAGVVVVVVIVVVVVPSSLERIENHLEPNRSRQDGRFGVNESHHHDHRHCIQAATLSSWCDLIKPNDAHHLPRLLVRLLEFLGQRLTIKLISRESDRQRRLESRRRRRRRPLWSGNDFLPANSAAFKCYLLLLLLPVNQLFGPTI